jgi:hypothetical protein
MKKILLIFSFVLYLFGLTGQDIYVVNGQNELKILHPDFSLTDLFQIDIAQAGYIIDLAFAPDGTLYGVTNYRYLIEIDLVAESFSIVTVLPAGANYPGLVCNADNELFFNKWLQLELFKYDLDTGNLSFVETGISTPGDFTFYKGNLIYPSFFNDFIKSYDGTQIMNVGCAVPLTFAFVNVFNSCEDNAVYAIDEVSKVYLYDIDGGTYQEVADVFSTAGAIKGAATTSEYMASACPLVMLTEYTCETLPVVWGSFEGEMENTEVHLFWQTFTERDNFGFEIERSTDALHWQRIGFVDGQGNALETTAYEFTDGQPAAGRNYYRLKQLDYDGQANYSKTISIDYDTGYLHLFPNPAEGLVNIVGIPEGVIKIFDLKGREVLVQNFSGVPVDISTLPQGIFIAQVIAGGKALVRKICKQ